MPSSLTCPGVYIEDSPVASAPSLGLPRRSLHLLAVPSVDRRGTGGAQQLPRLRAQLRWAGSTAR